MIMITFLLFHIGKDNCTMRLENRKELKTAWLKHLNSQN